MGILIAKSKENLTSAQLLIDNDCHNSSVHCSYYSSVQLMIHLLLNKFGYTPDKLETDSKRENKGSHIFAKNFLYQKMKDNNEIFKARDFFREIGELKNKREKADYQEAIINPDLSGNALEQANKVNTILTKVFEIQ